MRLATVRPRRAPLDASEMNSSPPMSATSSAARNTDTPSARIADSRSGEESAEPSGGPGADRSRASIVVCSVLLLCTTTLRALVARSKRWQQSRVLATDDDDDDDVDDGGGVSAWDCGANVTASHLASVAFVLHHCCGAPNAHRRQLLFIARARPLSLSTSSHCPWRKILISSAKTERRVSPTNNKHLESDLTNNQLHYISTPLKTLSIRKQLGARRTSVGSMRRIDYTRLLAHWR